MWEALAGEKFLKMGMVSPLIGLMSTSHYFNQICSDQIILASSLTV